MTSNVYALEYIAEGTGPNRKAAIQDSFRIALEKVVGIAINTSTYVRNNTLIRDQIYSHSDGYIRSYEILKESEDDGKYTVKTKVIIDMEPSSKLMTSLDKVRTIHMGIGDPRIGIVILNHNNNNQTSDASAENAIASSLNKSGFSHVINMNQLAQIKKEHFQAAVDKGDINTIALLGAQEQLDYIVTGSISSNDIEIKFDTQVPIKSNGATLNVNTTKCDTGETIQLGQYEDSGIDITQKTAAENAKYKTGEKAGYDIANRLVNYAATALKNYTIYVHDIKDQTNLSLLKDYLNNINGMQDIYIRSYANNTAVIDISFNGDNQALASYLTEDLACPANITKITNSTIDLTFQK
jgi:hypothetical protein